MIYELDPREATDRFGAFQWIRDDIIAFEAWEHMTMGGVTAKCDDIVPHNVFTNVGGMVTSYPIRIYKISNYRGQRLGVIG